MTVHAGTKAQRLILTLPRASGASKAPAAKPPAATTKPPAAKAPATKPPAASKPVRPVPAPAPADGAAVEIETRPPGVRVRLDNRDVGVSPLVVGALAEGTHTIRLELDGYKPWSTTVTVKAGARHAHRGIAGKVIDTVNAVLASGRRVLCTRARLPAPKVWRPAKWCSTPGLTGYQEILTDPSYAGQIVTMTCPEIGNYGVADDDVESRAPQVSGFVDAVVVADRQQLARVRHVARLPGSPRRRGDRRTSTRGR